MTPRSALLKQTRATLFAAAAFGLALIGAGGAKAEPVDLTTDAGVADLAHWMAQYRGVSNARWIIAARSQTEAEAKKSAVAALLEPRDFDLLQRIDVEINKDGAPRAWLNPVVGATRADSSCSWQVWVDDPRAPGPSKDPVLTPLSPNDHIAVGPSATFRVGHAGLVQSHLYAFGETRAGAVRDLVNAPDVNIPIAREPEGETIVLATARQASPFFESVKTALSQAQGERVELGPKYDLRGKMSGGSRGIGANIQAIPNSMIAAPATKAAVTASGEPAPGGLLEVCVYQITPRF